jgi:hypothetical protein
MTKRIYISGPMSDISDLNRKAFEDMASRLRGLNFLPLIPHDNGLPITATYNAHLVRDIEIMLTCDAVVVLEGWQHSKGASIEAFTADQMGIKVFFEGKTHEQELIDWNHSTHK